MNVNDFQDIAVPEGDKLETIFNHQRDLVDRYHAIEERNVGHKIPSNIYWSHSAHRGWDHAGPLNINDRFSQLRLKDFAWRITEELTEATLSLIENDPTHYLEELIDALHFSVELLIMCGIEPYGIFGTKSPGDQFERLFNTSAFASEQEMIKLGVRPEDYRKQYFAYKVIEQLGEAMNRLKLKPWKTTAVMTDESAFKHSMIAFFVSLIDLLKVSGFTAHSATVMYLQKNAVNQFRQRTNY